MATSSATSVQEYLRSLAAERRRDIEAVRDVVRAHLPAGFEEGMQYGMIGYYVPLSRYPVTYNGQPLGVAALASQKNYMSLYLMGVYADPAVKRDFEAAYAASGKKLDMGKSCLRFKRAADLPLDVIAKVIASVSVDEFIRQAEAAKAAPTRKRAPAKKKAPGKRTTE